MFLVCYVTIDQLSLDYAVYLRVLLEIFFLVVVARRHNVVQKRQNTLDLWKLGENGKITTASIKLKICSGRHAAML